MYKMDPLVVMPAKIPAVITQARKNRMIWAPNIESGCIKPQIKPTEMKPLYRPQFTASSFEVSAYS